VGCKYDACDYVKLLGPVATSFDAFAFHPHALTQEVLALTDHPQNVKGAENFAADAFARAGFHVFAADFVDVWHYHCFARDWKKYQASFSLCQDASTHFLILQSGLNVSLPWLNGTWANYSDPHFQALKKNFSSCYFPSKLNYTGSDKLSIWNGKVLGAGKRKYRGHDHWRHW